MMHRIYGEALHLYIHPLLVNREKASTEASDV